MTPFFGAGLQRRLTLALVLSVVVTTLVLGVGSYLLISYSLERRARDEAVSQSRFNLVLARSILPPKPSADDYDALLRALAIRGSFETVLLAGGSPYVSGPQVSRALVTPELAARVEAGRLAYQTVLLDGVPAYVVGGRVDATTSAYFFYPLDDEQAVLSPLRAGLAAAGIVLVLLGSVLAAVLARRLGRPILRASAAASRMAAGELEVRLPPAAGEFGVLSSSFNRMAQNLSEKVQALTAAEARERRFVGDVAHELRTPLAALVGEVSLLEEQLREPAAASLPDDTKKAFALLARDVGRLRRLVDELLELSRIDAQAPELAWEELDLLDFLGRLVAARHWPVGVTAHPPFAPAAGGDDAFRLLLRTDRRRLERVVVNLVENALLHGAPPVDIDVAPGEGGGGGELSVSVVDRGPGISPQSRERIFQRFFKADPSRSSPGSGLGLAIAWENARLLGGRLTLSEAPGPTRFVLHLPALAPVAWDDPLPDRYPPVAGP